jgi:hypothetical protein
MKINHLTVWSILGIISMSWVYFIIKHPIIASGIMIPFWAWFAFEVTKKVPQEITCEPNCYACAASKEIETNAFAKNNIH